MSMPIVSVNIMGGLGNQLFQIAAAYAYSKKENGKLQIEYKKENGNRSLYWNTLLKSIQPYLVASLPCLEKWYENEATQYKEISKLTNSGKYLEGYYQSSKYFYNDEIKQDIKTLFQCNPFLLHHLQNTYSELFKNRDRIVVIHARRTDYIKYSHVHGPLNGNYYKNAIQKILEVNKNPYFVLTSDDNTFWNEIKNDIIELYNYPYMIIENESDIHTFTLLQQFDYFIMSNSTFIWWCVWLSKAKYVIAPSKWFGPYGPKYYDDIYEKEWIRIESS